ncbi:PREDICTED: uncharacterized protein LOC101301568 [Fragaria vesca subsp. vesca]|uniref:uncharacterized protein LOC101301568 n=1 Tax=Fragaria vesca subsp. vesca TaxID=101020 RepID=UPI0002C3279E|nr:PREDICTED: uncharacterized protein LOC101301568 [Fragaria vesca subsp. vesca]
MDQLQHFSHGHPLMFKEEAQKDKDGRAVVCRACGDPVLGPSYSCGQCSQLFILHKSCAYLPREMHHPIHNKHPLILLPNINYRCDICRRSHSGLFSYRCRPCNYDLDIQCASDLSNIKYIEHFSHEHALIFVEDPKRREKGLPVVCQGCQEDVSGPGYCCSRFLCHYTLHKSCAELPREMHHPIHRKHPLVLSFMYGGYTCDICWKTHYNDLFAYRCEPCRFELHLQCASDLSNIKYLEHFSHEHALIIDEHSKRDYRRRVCQGCKEEVLDPRYRCSCILCWYYLHKSCAEMPVEIHHPMHPKHPLILNKAGAKQYLCDACGQDCSGKFTYSCFQCDLNLHPECTSIYPNFIRFSHVHPLMFNEGEQKYEDGAAATVAVACPPVVCSACGDPIHGPSYSCNQCSKLFILHKSCGDLPRKMYHTIHNKHPLVLLSDRNYCCDICRRSHSGLFSYRCSPCKYELDIQCVSDLSNIKYIEHFSHEHALIFVEDPKRREEGLPVVCQGCQEDVSGPGYCCSRFLCHYTLHKSCAELPSEFRHPMHTEQHPLVLNKDGRGFQCDLCDQDCSRRFTYSCFQCDFNLDSKCAFKWTSFKHFSHEHPLFEREPKKYFGLLFCDGCQDPILTGPSYTCINTFRRRKCGFNLHKKCYELPHEIEHPMHCKHPLFLHNILPDIKRVRRLCNVCNKPGRLLYCCSICDFNLHLKCSSNWQSILANDSHEHQFTVLWKKMSDFHVKCEVCGDDWTATVYFMCSICQLLVHKECASLPRSIKKPEHQHQLKLTWFLDNICPNNLSCKVCSLSIDKCRAAYRCGECINYVSHVACTTAEYSREDSFVDIVLNENGFDDALEITHFSHPHPLAANDPCEEVKDEHILITCEGCIRPITATKESFYSCTKQEDELCSFFLHKVCAQLPKKKRLPLLHQHQFTLLSRAPSVGGVFQCYMCGAFNQGFTYTCEECASQKGETVFFLDLQCNAYWDNKALIKHDSHVHRLLLDTEWDNVHCSSCGCNIFFCFSCKRCEFRLCIPCVRLPLTARHRYDDHPLKLTYASVYDELGYYCQICEGTRDPTQWFYRCNDCDFDCHAHCIVGRYPQVKLGSTYKHEAHAQHLVALVDKARSPIRFDKRENILPCLKCGEPCVGLVYECRECNINIHREGFCQVTALESSTNQASKEEPSQ